MRNPAVRPSFDALILDMDGVLADTEPLHVRAWMETLKDLDPAAVYEERGRLMGMASHEIAGELIRQFRLTIAPSDLVTRKRAAYRRIIDRGVHPFDGLAGELMGCRDRPLALATSSPREEADLMLARLGFSGLFSPVITSSDVQRTKPAPDCYILAAERLGTRPRNCLVLEDSPNGMLAAIRAGARVLAITTIDPMSLPRGTHAVFPSTVEALRWLRAS
jgi:beta-phosphoglucomutase